MFASTVTHMGLLAAHRTLALYHHVSPWGLIKVVSFSVLTEALLCADTIADLRVVGTMIGRFFQVRERERERVCGETMEKERQTG